MEQDNSTWLSLHSLVMSRVALADTKAAVMSSALKLTARSAQWSESSMRMEVNNITGEYDKRSCFSWLPRTVRRALILDKIPWHQT
jgi:hypothetical protein